MSKILAYGASSATTDLDLLSIARREVGPFDVQIDIEYCGVCHSDLHVARNDWKGSVYPVVPGHEIIGRVVQVGDKSSKYKVGDLVGVGCMVDSCRHCSACADELQQHCENGTVFTYGSEDVHLGGKTFGGYSQRIVVNEDFVLRVPQNLDVSAVAPLLCAGITMYSPLRRWQVEANSRVGIIGLGGLGHIGVKLAAAMGAEVTMITTSPEKGEDAKHLGADHVLLSGDEQAMTDRAGYFDLLIDTVPRSHDLNPYVALLKHNGTLVMVGSVEPEHSGIFSSLLIIGRRHVTGSLIGGISETQEMLDFCGKHNIVCDVEMIDMQQINQAYTRMLQSEVKYRFVIDMKSLK